MSSIFLNEDLNALKGGVGIRLEHDITSQVHRADDVLPLWHVHYGEVVRVNALVDCEALDDWVVQNGVWMCIVLVRNPLVLKLNCCVII